MSREWCTPTQGGIRITVQITPNAKKSEVIGVLEDTLKIKLQAQPIEGKANEALVRFLADMLDVPKSAVTITHGHTNKRKIIEVSGASVTVERARQVLLPTDAK
ncbi:DUF167 domain-containing protein [Herbaspirillum sp. HC18]|nr:DUF167 domain-containing protein [Herbaspirillum sp. HC18]